MSVQEKIEAGLAFEPGADPAKLAQCGAIVRAHLDRNPHAERLPLDGAEIYRVPGFLSRKDCKAICRAINRHAVPSTLYRGADREGFRTSFTHHFERDNPQTRSVEEYISDLMAIDDIYSEPMQGQRYQIGQEFKHHHDYFHVGEGYWRQEAKKGGQRTWTAMICLHQAREGGETDFPHLGLRVTPAVGEVIIWNNMRPDGTPNPKTLHSGMPVKRGIKHVVTKWYRQEPWRLLNPS